MYTEVRLHESVTDYLTQWEDDHDIPVRVLNGRFRTGVHAPVNNWTDRHCRDVQQTRQEASAHGLTIISTQSSCPQSYLNYGVMYPVPPSTVNPNDYAFNDIIGVRTDAAEFTDVEPIVWDLPDGTPYTFGEIGDRVVYFYMNLGVIRQDQWDLAALFAGLEDAINPEAAEERAARLVNESFDNFLNYMSRDRIETQVNRLRQNVQANEQDIIAYQNSIATAISAMNSTRTQIDAMLNAQTRTREEWAREFEQIANHAAVDRVIFRNSSLRIYTHPIHLRGAQGTVYENETRWLGRFQVDINLTNNQISSIRNLDNAREGRDHPHVPDGRPCFGGHATEFMTLLGNAQFGVFFELLVHWLETYNPDDDWGRTARLWFAYPDNNPELQQDEPVDTTETEDELAFVE